MAQADLATLNGAIVSIMKELEGEHLLSDARERLEKDLFALVEMRLAIEKQANRTVD